jgi:hypothetical protein
MAAEPYQIAVPDSDIEKLKSRLADTRLPDELNESAWDYGAPLADVKRLVAYWRDQYDWRAAEAKINQIPQFRATIQADNFEPLKIHFIHHKSPVVGAIPLLFCHGCMSRIYHTSCNDHQLKQPQGLARSSRSPNSSPSSLQETVSLPQLSISLHPRSPTTASQKVPRSGALAWPNMPRHYTSSCYPSAMSNT